jgi:hypothetical protein
VVARLESGESKANLAAGSSPSCDRGEKDQLKRRK